jgi:hypothetical protein
MTERYDAQPICCVLGIGAPRLTEPRSRRSSRGCSQPSARRLAAIALTRTSTPTPTADSKPTWPAVMVASGRPRTTAQARLWRRMEVGSMASALQRPSQVQGRSKPESSRRLADRVQHPPPPLRSRHAHQRRVRGPVEAWVLVMGVLVARRSVSLDTRGRRAIGDGGLVQGVKQRAPRLKSSRDPRRLKRRLATLCAAALQQNRARRIPVVAATVRPDRSAHLPGERRGDPGRRAPAVPGEEAPVR